METGYRQDVADAAFLIQFLKLRIQPAFVSQQDGGHAVSVIIPQTGRQKLLPAAAEHCQPFPDTPYPGIKDLNLICPDIGMDSLFLIIKFLIEIPRIGSLLKKTDFPGKIQCIADGNLFLFLIFLILKKL